MRNNIDNMVVPFICGVTGSLFFHAVNRTLKSTDLKDKTMLAHLAWGGVIFIGTAYMNMSEGFFDRVTTKCNFFFFGTALPVLFKMTRSN